MKRTRLTNSLLIAGLFASSLLFVTSCSDNDDDNNNGGGGNNTPTGFLLSEQTGERISE